MNGYENTTALANECENQYNLLKEERERHEAEERERYRILEKEYEAKKERHKIFRGLSIFFAALATIMVFILNNLDTGLGILIFIVAFINLIPFLVIFNAECYHDGRKVLFMAISILFSIFVLVSCIKYGRTTTALILCSVALGIFNSFSCILPLIFPKD
jgi:hypothetical protein